MGNTQGKISTKSPFGCVLAHWRDLNGTRGTENKRTLIKYCNQWWPLCKLEDGAKWPLNGTIDYNTILQLMLFLRREGKWDEVSYTDMFFTLRNHPEWQRNCGMVPPQDPLMLALERERGKGNIKRCCSACSTGQRCTRADKIHQMPEPELNNLYRPPTETKELDEESNNIGLPFPPPPLEPSSPVASHIRSKTTPTIIQALLREALEGRMLLRVTFATADLEAWKRVAGEYQSDPVSVAKHFRFIGKQHNPDWQNIQLLLEHLTETEKQQFLKVASDLAEDHYKTVGGDIKEYFPLQEPRWDPDRDAHLERLKVDYEGDGEGYS
ncbi:PREDICTED: natural cytotoxicity triggering receptor 3 ligand 1 [Apaloderma vittatum]|uniref:natural cytotoxicity triggering receptor 3 ligand 1 n=1 Tax=Apaloderma vittatum TaxID=57397 RepID=UPI0005218BDA|nr:PREDICTED: natural cytotoxicity triggering receptor 3 ligand 1 [Apaloderma vittatum]